MLSPNPDKRRLIFDILLPEKAVLKQFATKRPTNFDNIINNKQPPIIIGGGVERSLKRVQTSLKKLSRNKIVSLNPSPEHSNKFMSYQHSP